MARAHGARAQTAIAFETTYGTAPGSGFWKVPIIRNGLSASQALLEDEVLCGRDSLPPDLDVQVVDGDIVVPVDTEAFGVWLKAAFGDPVTTGSGPYTHVFNSNSWGLPSMSAEVGMPEVPHYAMSSGVKVDRLSWEMQRAGKIQATVGVIAQGEAPPVAASVAGTLTEFAYNRFSQRHGKLTREASDLGDVVSAEITYRNNLDRVEVVREDGKLDGLDEGKAMLGLRLTTRFASQALLTQATDGTAAAFTLELTRSAGESLAVSIPRLFLPRPKVTVEGPQGVQATFDAQAAVQVDGNPMVTVTLVNDVSAY